MRFISTLLYGNFFIAVLFACLIFLCQFNLSRNPIIIDLGIIDELAKTMTIVKDIQLVPEIIKSNIANNNSEDETININSIVADIKHKKNYFKNNPPVVQKQKKIQEYKSVIAAIDINTTAQEIKIKPIATDHNIIDTLSKKEVVRDGNINNNEILKTYEQKFTTPQSLDLVTLKSKLINAFKKLNDIQVAEDIKRNNEKTAEQKNVIAQSDKKPTNLSINEKKELQSLDEVNTQLAKTNIKNSQSVKIQNLNKFEQVENLDEATPSEYSKINNPDIEKMKKPLSVEEVDFQGVSTDDASAKKNDYSPSNSKDNSTGISTQIDDFYVIDYSKNNNKKMDSQSVVISQMTGVSNRLAEVIKREKINNTKAKNQITPKLQKSPSSIQPDKNMVERLEVAYENTTKSNKSKQIESSPSGLLANLTLKATRVKFGKGLMEEVHSFQFIPAYNNQDALFDRGEGEINLSRELNTKFATIPGRVIANNFVGTSLDVLLEEGDFGINVPVFHAEDFKNFLTSKNANLPGGFILIELDELVEDVNLETDEGKYLYLSDSFKIVDEQHATFVLIAGVEPGNVLIKYLIGDQVAQKIIHVVEDEIFFENASFVRGDLDIFDLMEEGLLIKKEKALDISNEQIKYFNYQSTSQKESLYTYSIKTPYKSLGARKYLELTHLKAPIFLGYYEKTSLTVPNQAFIEYILEAFNYENLETSCIIQLNLENNPEEIFYSGNTSNGQLGLEVKYLDEEGKLYSELTETTEKIFINGDRHGVVNIEVKYYDGKYDYIQTYCSMNTYLIEQL